MSAEGLLLVDKPRDCSSHDVVVAVRRLLGERRVGHAGTLDPFATGLLVCLVGRATRLARFLQRLDKTYSGWIRLGFATDTGDREGAPLADARPAPPETVLRAVAEELEGPQDQVPPAFSAKKIDGRRAYRLARAGRPVELGAVRVVVHRFAVGPLQEDRLPFRAEVSSGTYLRRLAADLGDRAGCGAHLDELRREAVGPLVAAAALRLDDADRSTALAALLPLERAPLEMPTLRVSDDEATAARRGQRLGLALATESRVDVCRLLDPAGRLVAVAEIRAGPGEPCLLPRVVFP